MNSSSTRVESNSSRKTTTGTFFLDRTNQVFNYNLEQELSLYLNNCLDHRKQESGLKEMEPEDFLDKLAFQIGTINIGEEEAQIESFRDKVKNKEENQQELERLKRSLTDQGILSPDGLYPSETPRNSEALSAYKKGNQDLASLTKATLQLEAEKSLIEARGCEVCSTIVDNTTPENPKTYFVTKEQGSNNPVTVWDFETGTLVSKQEQENLYKLAELAEKQGVTKNQEDPNLKINSTFGEQRKSKIEKLKEQRAENRFQSMDAGVKKAVEERLKEKEEINSQETSESQANTNNSPTEEGTEKKEQEKKGSDHTNTGLLNDPADSDIKKKIPEKKKELERAFNKSTIKDSLSFFGKGLSWLESLPLSQFALVIASVVGLTAGVVWLWNKCFGNSEESQNSSNRREYSRSPI